jgi:hypothetical protein
MQQVADLGFVDPIFFVIFGFLICGFATCGYKYFCELKASAIPKIHTFSPYDALNQIFGNNRDKKATFRTVLIRSCEVPYFEKKCGFAIC